MKDEADRDTMDLWDDAFCDTGALPVDQVELSEQYEAGVQNAHARANSAHFAAVQADAQTYASQISRKVQQEGFKPVALHGYTDADGQPIYFKLRLKHPDTGQKWIRAISPKPDGTGWQSKEPDFKTVYPSGNGKKPLYRLHELVQENIGLPVYIFEGEQKADLAARMGLLATTCGGSNSIATTDLAPLAGRSVILWADHDEAGLKACDELVCALQAIDCTVAYIDLNPLGLPNKGDIVDWVELRTQDGMDTIAADIAALAIISASAEPSVIDCRKTLGNEVLSSSSDSRKILEDDAGTSLSHDMANNEADIITIINELAQLPPLAYEQCRQSQAKILGMRAGALDRFVSAARKEQEAASTTDSLFSEVIPYPEPVDGAQLVEQISAIIDRHIVCQPATTIATALWIMFTWCIDAAQIAPIACITAPEKRCGKTQLLTLIGELVYQPMPVSNITAAALFRSIEKWQPTLLIDEADSFMKDNEDLRGIINAGHSRKNAYVIRTTGDNFEPTRFTVWGAKAISGIGHLPETLKDRSIILELRRKQPHETRQRLRHADPAEFELLRCKLCRWAVDNVDAIKQARPELPDALNDRAQDNWEILLSIADLLGEDWSKKARHAALSISGIEEQSPSVNEELLGDIKAIFARINQAKVSSDDLINHLSMDDELLWATWNRGKPMTKKQLAGRLSEFGISPKQIWFNGANRRGYELSDFNDAFSRYLPNSPILNARTLDARQANAFNDISSARQTQHLADKNALNPLSGKSSNTLADSNHHTNITQQNGTTITAAISQRVIL